jgi:LysR family transcriptional regulator (chromosome initiation inhibitor)
VSQRLRSLEDAIGQPLVIRTRPLALTEAGKVLLRFARQWQALRSDAERELGARLHEAQRLPIAVNADSLATWVLPALDPIVQSGHGLELVVDDQDFTHDWLRQGAVLGCVSSVREALRGCRVRALGVMHYTAAASPAFIEQHLPRGLTRDIFAHVPFLVFNRKDDMQAQWVSRAFGIRSPRLMERFVPSSEAYARAAAMGWGIGVLPLLQAAPFVDAGQLRLLAPDVTVPVALHWHQWHAGQEFDAPQSLLDRVGAALADGARAVLV